MFSGGKEKHHQAVMGYSILEVLQVYSNIGGLSIEGE